jgi:hypothetical protein
MKQHKLNNGLTFMVEQQEKKLRLILADGGRELACHKETPGKLRRFLSSTQNQLFDGRLQLHKTEGSDVIVILLNGHPVGELAITELEKLLE